MLAEHPYAPSCDLAHARDREGDVEAERVVRDEDRATSRQMFETFHFDPDAPPKRSSPLATAHATREE